MTQKPKKVPDFKSEDAERRFWATHDSSEYLDWSGATRPTAELEAVDRNHLAAPAEAPARQHSPGGKFT